MSNIVDITPAQFMNPKPRADFFGEAGFVPARLGAALNEERPLRLGIDGSLYHYLDGVWRRDGLNWAKARIRDLLGDRFQRRRLDEVIAWLRAAEPSIGVEPSTRLINLENGMLDWQSGQLIPHDPDLLSMVRIPVGWNPAATCPTVDSFLIEVLPGDSIEFVLEIIGYLLLPTNRFQKAVLLLGPAGNGKGTLLQLIRALLGVENVASLSLHKLAEDRFAAASLVGRLANICGDLDARTVERSDTFKMITGGDAITAERKYADLFSFTPFCRLLFSANAAPLTADQSLAYFDRWLVIPMTRRIRGTEQEIPDYHRQLTTKVELQGLLVQAVGALRRLMARGRFEIPATVREANEHYRSELDSVAGFVAEQCRLTSQGWIARPTLYERYQIWCSANGRKPLSSRHVYDRIRELDGVGETTRTGTRGFSGIAFDEPKPAPSAPEFEFNGAKGATAFHSTSI